MDPATLLVLLGWAAAYGLARRRVLRRVIPVDHPLLAVPPRND